MKTIAMVVVMVAAGLAMADEKPKSAAKPIKGHDQVQKLIPRELFGTDNAAKGAKYDRLAIDDWLAKNVHGRQFESAPFQFTGKVDEILSHWIKPQWIYIEDDAGDFVTSYADMWLIIKKESREPVAKLKASDLVVAHGVIRKAWVIEDGEGRFVKIGIAISDAAIRPAKVRP